MERTLAQSVSRILNGAQIRFETKCLSLRDGGAAVEFRQLPGGKTLFVSYHPAVVPHQLAPLLAHLRTEAGPKRYVGLCVRQLTWALLDACKTAHTAVFDLEGNAYVQIPGLYIERLRPCRQGGPEPSSGTVFTARAVRLVRALLKTYPEGWVQVDLVRATRLSAGYVSTLMKRLTAQGYVREERGLFRVEEPDRLLDDWVAHYRFDRHRRLSFALSTASYEDGIERLGKTLGDSVRHFAWTGWTGAYLRAPYTTPTVYTAFVSEMPGPMRNIFPVQGQGNVILYVPQDTGVLQFATASSSGAIVSDAQLYADLYRMPGRAKEQADALRHQCLEFGGNTKCRKNR